MDVIIAARRSQIAKGYTQTGIESQDEDARDWAESEGHNVIATVPDTASGKKAMWQRKNLKSWVTDPALMMRYQESSQRSRIVYHAPIGKTKKRCARGQSRTGRRFSSWTKTYGGRHATIPVTTMTT